MVPAPPVYPEISTWPPGCVTKVALPPLPASVKEVVPPFAVVIVASIAELEFSKKSVAVLVMLASPAVLVFQKVMKSLFVMVALPAVLEFWKISILSFAIVALPASALPRYSSLPPALTSTLVEAMEPLICNVPSSTVVSPV